MSRVPFRLQGGWFAARQRARGQVLALMGVGMVAVIAFAGVVIDGGNVFAQQRAVQNGTDAAAEAGAIILAERLDGQPTPVGGWDAAVQARINALLAANKVTLGGAYYTDICGIPLQPDGTAALDAQGHYDLSVAAQVGSGIPTSSATNPDCPNLVVGPPAGVLVIGKRSVDTYLARVVGINTFTPTTQGTAVSGWLTGLCDFTQGSDCAVLPITIPVNIVTCNGQNNPVNTGNPWQKYVIYRVPLCGNNPGNVGWIDWTPPSGGSSELVQSILHPNNPPISLPSWEYVTQTGDPNSQPIDNAVNTYDGQVILIPMFDATCDATPDNTQPAVSTPNNFGCPAGHLGGNGQNQWYRFPSFAAFQLCSPTMTGCNGFEGAYINGNNSAECDSGNGATSCLIGQFVDFIRTGTVQAGSGGGSGGSKVVGVQLIK